MLGQIPVMAWKTAITLSSCPFAAGLDLLEAVKPNRGVGIITQGTPLWSLQIVYHKNPQKTLFELINH